MSRNLAQRLEHRVRSTSSSNSTLEAAHPSLITASLVRNSTCLTWVLLMNADDRAEDRRDEGADMGHDNGFLECDDRSIVLHDRDGDESSSAVCKSTDHDGDEGWRESQSLTLNNLLHDLGLETSTVLSPCTPTEVKAGTYTQMFRWSMPLEARTFRAEYKGFLCPLHTSMGPSAGSTRMVVHGVRVRVMSQVTLQFLDKLVSLLHCAMDGECEEGALVDTVVMIGREVKVAVDVVPLLLEAYMSTSNSYHTPTVHVTGERTYCVSVNTGALMRFVEGLGWVDTIMGDETMPQLWDTKSISPHDTSRYTSLFSSQTSMTPFGMHMPEQRAALSGHFLGSSISRPVNTLTHRMSPTYTETPLVVTEHCAHVFQRNWDRFPGRNVSVVFFQCTLTYEDAFLMSETCARSFTYAAETVVVMPGTSLQAYSKGDVIPPLSKEWWGVPVQGVVVSVQPIKFDRTRMVVSRSCHAVSGDKFCTTHGQKGVITVMPDERMPSVDGAPVDFVMGSTTLIKRNTPSQLYEAWAGQEAYERRSSLPTLDTSYDVRSLRRNSVIVTNNALPDRLAGMRQVRAEYGRIRLMQTCHMTYDKHQYTRKAPTKGMRASPRGRVVGGGVRLGEMELQQLSGNGLTKCLEELQLRGNCVDAAWCAHCKKLMVTCCCDGSTRKRSSIRVLPRNASVHGKASVACSE
ncbi:unnamed protein product [Scytosiphon promiscuus]